MRGEYSLFQGKMQMNDYLKKPGFDLAFLNAGLD